MARIATGRGWCGVDLNDSLQRAIAKVCDCPPTDVQPETRLDDLGVDSLAVAEIIVELEIELDIELPVHLLRQLDRIETVGQVADELRAALDDDGSARGAPSTPSS